MKLLKKVLNILVVMSIILTTFLPPITVHALDEDLSKSYKVYIYYPGSSDNIKVQIASYDNYNDALKKVNEYPSEAYATAGIEKDNRVLYATYALVHMDGGNNNRSWNDLIYNIYPTSNLWGTILSSYAGTWGVDAAFLDYDPNTNAVKVKASGLTGWVSLNNVTITPISAYYGYTYKYTSNRPKVRIISNTSITMREGASTSSNQVCDTCYANHDEVYTYDAIKTVKDSEYTWYYVSGYGREGYIASKDDTWVKVENTLLTDTFYYAYNNTINHYIHLGLKYFDTSILIGDAPKNSNNNYYLKNNNSTYNNNTYMNCINRYLSFDGNYFYTDFKDMIDDYRNNIYTHAINYEYPYYSYFMYVPSHTLTNITKETINNSLITRGVTSPLTHEVSYYYNQDGSKNHDLGNESILYNTGSIFVDAANTYGISPMSIYTAAMRESGNGRSAIALVKNNLFGYGAADDDPFNKAYTYSSIEESIKSYANVVGGTSNYTNIYHEYYHGTHKGNKLSGTFVYYMTDPYGGEKDASLAFQTDRESGSTEIYSNTLGIKNSTDVVKIYKKPSSQSDVIYETKNYSTGITLSNMPFIVVDKVYVEEDSKKVGYYKIYTDVALDENQNVNPSTLYSFNNSYGYIKEEDLYVSNHQPVIEATDIEIKQFDNYDLLKNVKANDFEDGNINDITYKTNLNNEVYGNYEVTYTAKDKSNFNVSKTVNIKVTPAAAPIIKASDISIIQYKTFDPKKGVTVIDNHYGDITDSLEVIENNVDVNKLGTYTVKYSAKNESGIKSEKVINVTVINNQKPEIVANNITKYLDDSFDYFEGVTASDYEDGELKNIDVIGSVDTTKIGEYILTYSVRDLDNQLTTKTITVTIEDREYENKDNVFYLDKLLYNEESKKVDFQGFLIIKDMANTLDTDIKYSIIFENQYNGSRTIKNLNRLTSNIPFEAPIVDNYNNEGSWFTSNLDLTDLESGNYSVYVRARSNNYETIVDLKNIFFNKDVSNKFDIDGKGFQFRTNYFSRNLALELIVRDEGLTSSVNNPTIDNMYNQVYDINLDGTKLTITGSSHNVGGDYGLDSDVSRYMMLENIKTTKQYLKTDIGYILDGPYKISLRVDDGFDKTKAWYKTTIDLKDLEKGTYSIIVRTKTNNIDDYGEIYDIINSDLLLSSNVGDKRITIKRNEKLRYRIEITVE